MMANAHKWVRNINDQVRMIRCMLLFQVVEASLLNNLVKNQ